MFKKPGELTLAVLVVLLVITLLGYQISVIRRDMAKVREVKREQVPTMTKFSSDILGIEFEYPVELEVNEKSTSIQLFLSDENDSQISLYKYGTSFKTAQEHVNSLISNWQNQPLRTQVQGKNTSGEGLEGLDSRGKYKVIFFVNKNTLYQLETIKAELFDDLDVIAKSFRIIEE